MIGEDLKPEIKVGPVHPNLMLDKSLNILDADNSVIQLLGKDEADKDLKGQNLSTLLINSGAPVRSNQSLMAGFEDASDMISSASASQDHYVPSEFPITTKEGKIRWLRFSPKYTHEQEVVNERGVGIHFKPKEGGQINGFAVEVSDITELRQSQAIDQAARLVTSNLDIEDILTNIQEILHTILPHNRANLMQLRNGTWRTKRKWTYDDKGKPTLHPFSVKVDLDKKPALMEMKNTLEPKAIPHTVGSVYETDKADASWVGAPLVVGGEAIGFINLNSDTPGLYSQADAALLMKFANHIGVAIENARLHSIDSKTGLFTHEYIKKSIQREIELSKKSGQQFSLIYLDIDMFKKYNDANGELMGDKRLEEVGSDVMININDTDEAGKWGGEEVVVIARGASKEIALAMAERIRKNVVKVRRSDTNIGNPIPGYTVSIGIATFLNDATTLEELVQAANNAERISKHSGRNRVTDSSTIPEDVRFETDEKKFIERIGLNEMDDYSI